MHKYSTYLSDEKKLNSYDFCAVQPYLSDDNQVNLLLRNHNWGASTNKSVEITYKTMINPIYLENYKGGYWDSEGQAIRNTINYISKAISKITQTQEGKSFKDVNKRYIPETIVADSNRGEYKLYEGNFLSSDAQTTYVLEVKLENIKRKLND
jgi:hypothetical protein